jgi:hypothetical protein
MSLYSTRPINKKDETNPYIETDYRTKEIPVGQPVPYRLQHYFNNQSIVLESLEDFKCLKCGIYSVEKKVFEKGFNYKFLVLYRKSYCQYCASRV